MKNNPKSNRSFGDIYFVLYLVALLLIVTDKKEEHIDFEIENANDFFIKTEKSSLNVRLTYSNEDIKILTADSTNFIYPIGPFKNIDYKIKIKNTNNKTRILFDSKENVTLNGFSVTEEKKGILKFIWEINKIKYINDNYEILVEAEVTKLDGTIIYTFTKFNINIFFVDQIPAFTDNLEAKENSNLPSNLNSSNIQTIFQTVQDGEITIYSENPIESVIFSKWENNIQIFGINLLNNLSELPEIKNKSNKDDKNLSFEIISQNTLKVKGILQSNNTDNIEIKLKRKSDGKIATNNFFVKAIPLGFAEYPKEMYPFKTYYFKPNLPILKDKKVIAKLTLNGDIILNSAEGSNFEYSPTAIDTNKTIFFERYINNELVDRKYPIVVKSYPLPEIKEMKQKNDVIYITTESFGMVNSDKQNLVKEIFVDGEIKNFIDLTGVTKFNNDKIIQTFKYTGNLKQGSKIRVQDSRGYSSYAKVLNY